MIKIWIIIMTFVIGFFFILFVVSFTYGLYKSRRVNKLKPIKKPTKAGLIKPNQ